MGVLQPLQRPLQDPVVLVKDRNRFLHLLPHHDFRVPFGGHRFANSWQRQVDFTILLALKSLTAAKAATRSR